MNPVGPKVELTAIETLARLQTSPARKGSGTIWKARLPSIQGAHLLDNFR